MVSYGLEHPCLKNEVEERVSWAPFSFPEKYKAGRGFIGAVVEALP